MSGPLINRSLTTVKTELEFLRDSEVITEELYSKLLGALPPKYTNDMQPWGVEKLGVNSSSSSPEKSAATEDDLSKRVAKVHLNETPATTPENLGYCEAIYEFQSEESGDINLKQGDKIKITEVLSDSWWKGFKKNDGKEHIGIFPANYVKKISESEYEEDFKRSSNERIAAPPKYESVEKPVASNTQMQAPNYGPNQGYQDQYQHQYQPQYQPQYGQPVAYANNNNAPYPPPSTNYYPPPQPQNQEVVVQQESGSHHGGHFKKFGSKLGNAAIFGAGASIGSNIVNSIFD